MRIRKDKSKQPEQLKQPVPKTSDYRRFTLDSPLDSPMWQSSGPATPPLPVAPEPQVTLNDLAERIDELDAKVTRFIERIEDDKLHAAWGRNRGEA